MLDATKLYTSKEFAEAIGLSKCTIDKLRRTGMPYCKLDGKNYWYGDSVITWIKDNYATDILKEVAKSQ